jgi:hypothetical protein
MREVIIYDVVMKLAPMSMTDIEFLRFSDEPPVYLFSQNDRIDNSRLKIAHETRPVIHFVSKETMPHGVKVCYSPAFEEAFKIPIQDIVNRDKELQKEVDVLQKEVYELKKERSDLTERLFKYSEQRGRDVAYQNHVNTLSLFERLKFLFTGKIHEIGES